MHNENASNNLAKKVEMQQLRYVCAVMSAQQIGGAARQLNISQPALSRSISTLERSLGVTLFERSRYGVTPTEFGRIFVRHAQAVLNEMDRAFENIDSLTGLEHGRISVGITPNFDQFLFPSALQNLLDQSPNIAVNVTSEFYEDLCNKVRIGELDFALSLLPDVNGQFELTEEPVLSYHMNVYARPDHPLANVKKISLENLSRFGWALPDQPAIRSFKRRFERQGKDSPQHTISTNSIALVQSAILVNGLLARLPDHLLKDEVKSGDVVVLDVADFPGTNQAALIYRTDSVLSPAAMELMTCIRQLCEKHTTT